MKVRTVLLHALSLSIAMMIGAAMPLTAQQPSTSTYVLVDGDRVTTQTRIGQQVRQRVEAAITTWETRLTTAQTELQALGQQRQSQQLTLSATALNQLNTQIEEKQVELQRMQEDARRQIEALEAEGQQEINDALIPVLEQMAAAEGYGLVFDTRMIQTGALLYYANSLDVTDDFISRVDAAGGGE